MIDLKEAVDLISGPFSSVNLFPFVARLASEYVFGDWKLNINEWMKAFAQKEKKIVLIEDPLFLCLSRRLGAYFIFSHKWCCSKKKGEMK